MDHFADRFWEPQALLEAAHQIRRSTPPDEFFCSSAFTQVREAIAMADFASRRPWNRDWLVRPVPKRERFPDAELKCGGDNRPFEVVEADLRDRRRGDEYKCGEAAPGRIRYWDVDREARAALDEIRRVVRGKAAKAYRPRPNLLVYVNLYLGESHEQPTNLYAAQLADLYEEHFESLWLLWGKETCRLWPNPAKIRAD